jgi:hypothetical protein
MRPTLHGSTSTRYFLHSEPQALNFLRRDGCAHTIDDIDNNRNYAAIQQLISIP